MGSGAEFPALLAGWLHERLPLSPVDGHTSACLVGETEVVTQKMSPGGFIRPLAGTPVVLRLGVEVAPFPPRATPTLQGATGVQRWERICPHPTSRTLVFCLRDVTGSDGWCAGRVGAGGALVGALPAQMLCWHPCQPRWLESHLWDERMQGWL